VWEKNSKNINITRHSKSWWNKECNKSLRAYRTLRKLDDWKIFQKTVKNTKCTFFDLKIQDIANKKREPWELINWINKHKMLAIEAIKYNNQLCLNIDNLWQALHLSFNTALHHSVNTSVLDEITFFSSSP